jgi:exosortase
MTFSRTFDQIQQDFPLSFWVKTAVLFSIWLCTFIPVYPGLWQAWMNDSNNSHGLLVPIIAGYLIWSKREQLLDARIGSSAWGALILGMSLFVYLLALAGHVAVLQRAMIVFSLIGWVAFNFGGSVFRVLAFPLLYLVFMVPVPDSIYTLASFPLQLFATSVSRFLIQTAGIPVLQEGNMLYFAQTQLEVAEACSGLRSMMAFIMLAALFAYLMQKGWWRRAILLAAAVPLAIVANIIRVTGVGVLAHFYGDQVARGFLHDFSGLAVFAFGFILLLGGYMLLNR